MVTSHIPKLLFIIIILIFCFQQSLNSHPHVFVDNSVTFVFGDNGLKGIALEWEFDDMFSSSLISDYDTDKNGDLSTAEIQKLKKEYFSDLIDYNYFCQIIADNEEIKVERVTNFSASIRNKEWIIYTFFIPLEIKAEKSYKIIHFSVFDPTYYVSIINAEENSIQVDDSSQYKYSYKIIDNTNRSDYYERAMAPEEIAFKFKI